VSGLPLPPPPRGGRGTGSPLLQRVTAGYLLLAALVEVVTNALFETRPAIERSLRAASPHLAGDQLRQSVSLGYTLGWLLVAVVVVGAAALAYGTCRGWRWVFWADLVVLVVGALQVFTNAVALTSPATQTQPPAAIAVDLVLSLLAFALLAWFVLTVARSGPWAMRRPPEPT
jgi:hypothetical protein